MIYRHKQFGTAEMITDAKTSTVIHSVENVSRVYKKRGLHISKLNEDGNVDTSRIRGAVAELNISLNPVS